MFCKDGTKSQTQDLSKISAEANEHSVEMDFRFKQMGHIWDFNPAKQSGSAQ